MWFLKPSARSHQQLHAGTRVRLWPADTHAKYGVVRKADCCMVTIEITETDPEELYYHPGDKLVLPWNYVRVMMKEFL